jgi:dihydropteroate synthase
MHNRDCAEYEDYMTDLLKDLQECIDIAHLAGIQDSQIILDPGVGFGKTFRNNLEIIKKVDALQQWQYPILLGTSRKSVIGLALDVDKNERLAGTIATTVMGVERGCKIFRVHDVKENYQAMKMALEILKA